MQIIYKTIVSSYLTSFLIFNHENGKNLSLSTFSSLNDGQKSCVNIDNSKIETDISDKNMVIVLVLLAIYNGKINLSHYHDQVSQNTIILISLSCHSLKKVSKNHSLFHHNHTYLPNSLPPQSVLTHYINHEQQVIHDFQTISNKHFIIIDPLSDFLFQIINFKSVHNLLKKSPIFRLYYYNVNHLLQKPDHVSLQSNIYQQNSFIQNNQLLPPSLLYHTNSLFYQSPTNSVFPIDFTPLFFFIPKINYSDDSMIAEFLMSLKVSQWFSHNNLSYLGKNFFFEFLCDKEAQGISLILCKGKILPKEQDFDHHINDNIYHNSTNDKEFYGYFILSSTSNIYTINFIVLIIFSALGCVYIFKSIIDWRLKCRCRMCQGVYNRQSEIGSGGFGNIFIVYRTKNFINIHKNEYFVMKQTKIEDLTDTDTFVNEARQLNRLNHQYIVKYKDEFIHRSGNLNGINKSIFQMTLMEYCRNGDLRKKIANSYSNFTEGAVREWIYQLVQAISYIHGKNLIHRDVKSENIFLRDDDSIKLGDFGLCRASKSNTKNVMSFAGTDCYMAPELFTSSDYGTPADMWSLGCTLLELCSGVFMDELNGLIGIKTISDKNFSQKIVDDLVTPNISLTLRSIIKHLLNADPLARPTAVELLRKKYFKKNSKICTSSFGYLEGRKICQEGIYCSGNGDVLLDCENTLQHSCRLHNIEKHISIRSVSCVKERLGINRSSL